MDEYPTSYLCCMQALENDRELPCSQSTTERKLPSKYFRHTTYRSQRQRSVRCLSNEKTLNLLMQAGVKNLRLFMNILKLPHFRLFLCYQYFICIFNRLKPKFRRKVSVSSRLANAFLFSFAFCCFFINTLASNRDGQPPRTIANRLMPVSRNKGEVVYLTCSVTGNPRPEIVWMKDGEQISREWKRFKQVGTRLKIRQAEPADSGLYQCQAVNGYGSGQTVHFQLDVVDRSPTGHSRRRETVKPIFTQPVKMRRHSFIKPQGGTVSFRCKAKGKPRPRIQWFKDGNRTEMKGSTGSSEWILTLRNINARDSGRYTCRVWNSAGEISFAYTLRVVGSQHERPVLLAPHPINTTVEVGGKTSLLCRVRSELPPTVKWIKRLSPKSVRSYNGQLPNNTLQIDGNYYFFLPSQEMVEMHDGSYLNKLVISHARLADSGIYICLGANTMGYTFRFAYLSVYPVSGEGSHRRTSSTGNQSLPLAAVIGVPAAMGVLIVCVITIYCANNRGRFMRWTKSSQIPQCDRPKMQFGGVSRLSSSSSTSAGNVEVVMDAHGTVKSQISRLGVSSTPLASTRSGNPLDHSFSLTPYRDKITSDFSESELASNSNVPPPPPPSQLSRSSWSTTRYSRSSDRSGSRKCCSQHRYHGSSRREQHAFEQSVSSHGSQSPLHQEYHSPVKH